LGFKAIELDIKLKTGTFEEKADALKEAYSIGSQAVGGLVEGGKLLGHGLTHRGDVLDAVSELGIKGTSNALGGATFETALLVTPMAKGAPVATVVEEASGEGAAAGVSRFRAIREALSDANGKLLQPVEREGVKHAIREIEKRSYELAGSVKYRGNQGIDLTFRGTAENTGRYALAEAKAGSGLGTLSTDALGIRQGSYEFFRTRLARGIAYGDRASKPFYREVYGALRQGDVDLLGSFAGGNRPPLRFDPSLFERSVDFRKVPGAAMPLR
jgi:hypothetical protein